MSIFFIKGFDDFEHSKKDTVRYTNLDKWLLVVFESYEYDDLVLDVVKLSTMKSITYRLNSVMLNSIIIDKRYRYFKIPLFSMMLNQGTSEKWRVRLLLESQVVLREVEIVCVKSITYNHGKLQSHLQNGMIYDALM